MKINQFAKTLFEVLNNGNPLTSFRKSGFSYIGISKKQYKLKPELDRNAFWLVMYNTLKEMSKYNTQEYRWLNKKLYELSIGNYSVYDIYNDDPGVKPTSGLRKTDKTMNFSMPLMMPAYAVDSKENEVKVVMELTVKGSIDKDRYITVRYDLYVAVEERDE